MMSDRNYRMFLGLGAAMAVGLSATPSFAAPSARDILVRSEDATRVRDLTSDIVMTTSSPGEAPKVKSFTLFRKAQSDNVRYQSLARFHTPAEVRGEGILFDERPNHDNQVLLYLPAFKKTRRVEGQAQSGSFMGSTFSYSDIATPHADDYQSKIVRTEACPGDGAVQCTVIEMLPANEGVKERTGYSKTVSWIRDDNFVQVQQELYDGSGTLWKRLRSSNVREIDPVAHKWLAHDVRVEDLKTKRQTTLIYDKVKANSGISESTFTRQSLEKAD